MFGYDSYNTQQPLTWWRGHPVHASTLLVVVHVAAMLLGVLLLGDARAISMFAFSAGEVLSGDIWRLITYAFVHPSQGLIWFAIEMYLLWSFGRELEKFLGHKAFLTMYGLLLIATPVLLTLAAFFIPSRPYVGSSSLHFAIFIAFATLYPGATMLFGITAKWAAIVLLAISALQHYGAMDLSGLLALGINAGLAHGYIRWSRGEVTLPSLNVLKRKPRFRVLPPPDPVAPRAARRIPEEKASMDDIDPLLDKIAKSGLNSLTEAEKAKLERARAALLKNDPRAR